VIKDQALEEPQEKEEEELPATLYTRQLYLPIMITVYQNLEPLNWDVLYLRQNMSVPDALALTAREKLDKQSLEWMETAEQPVEELLLMIQQTSDNDDKNPYCLLTLDVRNTWTVPFDLEFTVNNEGEDLLKSIVTIQPTWTKR
jgi:hypothetical protein